MGKNLKKIYRTVPVGTSTKFTIPYTPVDPLRH
jgi:hypothetical protein